MKLVILACLAAVALARPQSDPDHIEILRQETVDNGDGNFNYLFETENGIYKEVVGSPSANGAQAMRGSYRFPLDDGTIVEVTFTADENGYLPQSDAIPTPHPLPAHVIETLALVDELVRQGATWDDQGRRITRRK
uniref:Arthrodial cuticle protein AMP13.4 n=1 Tax=Callinectes sapidus TaxID=6763 RepID=Q2V6U3_CALSI|nr:arthrodial cuticle protein AMP13.4 [Callinectes sapidus]